VTANKRLIAEGLNPKFVLFSLQKFSQLRLSLAEPDFHFLGERMVTESLVIFFQGMAGFLFPPLGNIAVAMKI